jgi:hypothetical protein
VQESVSRRTAFNSLLAVLAIAIFGASLTGCGSSMSGPTPAKTTQVVMLLTSTANDQLSIFTTNLTSIALTNTAGMSTTIFTGANPQNGTPVEWMHLNGASEPLPAVSVPQGTYTSATVTVSNCTFGNVTFTNQILSIAEFNGTSCGQGAGSATVNLPNPIMVTGSVMALSLDLQVPQSFTLTGSGATAVVTASPVFNLTAVPVAALPTDETNGKVIGVAGQVMSLNMNGASFTAQTADGVSLTLGTNASTTFQGIAAFSSLSANLLVNFDAAIQSDGSLLATRVEVDDATAVLEAIGPFIAPAGGVGGSSRICLNSTAARVAAIRYAVLKALCSFNPTAIPCSAFPSSFPMWQRFPSQRPSAAPTFFRDRIYPCLRCRTRRLVHPQPPSRA